MRVYSLENEAMFHENELLVYNQFCSKSMTRRDKKISKFMWDETRLRRFSRWLYLNDKKNILFCLWIDIFLLAIFEGKLFVLLNNYKKKIFEKTQSFSYPRE